MISNKTETPYFGEDIYVNLPDILKKACSIYNSKREKDIFLISILTTIGTFFPNIQGEYDRMIKHPNLFTFIVGPPASGKGVMNNAKKAVEKIDKEFSKGLNLPEKYLGTSFISGNASDSEFINRLMHSKGVGIFFEAEADTIANTFKQDWGGFSDKLRKAGEHESFGKLRVSDDKEIIIEKPKLSVCISGTPDQLPKLVPSVSNGLFSRFLFYYYLDRPVFRYPGPDVSNINYDQFYEELGNNLLEMYNGIPSESITFKLETEYFHNLTEYFSNWQVYAASEIGEDFDSVVKRYAAQCYRIALILSIIRSWENKVLITDSIKCLDVDYQIAKSMIHVFLLHSRAVFELFKPDTNSASDQELYDLYNLLPKETKLDSEQCNELWAGRFCPRTASTRREQMVKKGLLLRIKKGLWEVPVIN